MNAAFLLLTSACLAQPPAAAAPAAPPAAAPAVVAAAPCGGCATSCADPCHRVSLLDKIKARLHSRSHRGCCDAAPSCNTCHAAPARTCHAAPSCAPACGTPLFKGSLFHKKDNCGGGCSGACDACPKVSLFDKIKAKLSCNKGSSCSSCGTPSCGGCGAAAPAAPAAPAAGGAAPMPMGGEKKQS